MSRRCRNRRKKASKSFLCRSRMISRLVLHGLPINFMNNVIGKMVMTLMTGWKPSAKLGYQLLVGQEMRDHDFKRR